MLHALIVFAIGSHAKHRSHACHHKLPDEAQKHLHYSAVSYHNVGKTAPEDEESVHKNYIQGPASFVLSKIAAERVVLASKFLQYRNGYCLFETIPGRRLTAVFLDSYPCSRMVSACARRWAKECFLGE